MRREGPQRCAPAYVANSIAKESLANSIVANGSADARAIYIYMYIYIYIYSCCMFYCCVVYVLSKEYLYITIHKHIYSILKKYEHL